MVVTAGDIGHFRVTLPEVHVGNPFARFVNMTAHKEPDIAGSNGIAELLAAKVYHILVGETYMVAIVRDRMGNQQIQTIGDMGKLLGQQAAIL